MTLKDRYKRFKAWQLEPFDWSFDENERHHCENCGNDFAGKFCPHCAQKAGLKKVSSIRLVVEVDCKDAAGTFAKIREAGGSVLFKPRQEIHHQVRTTTC